MKRQTRLKILKWAILIPTVLVGIGVGLYMIEKPEYVRATGYITTDHSAHVRPRTEGPIKEIKVRYGQRVEKGQVLVQLEDEIQQNNLDKARKALKVARDRLEQLKSQQAADIQRHKARLEEARVSFNDAKRRVEQERKLVASGASTQKRLDDLEAEMQQRQAHIASVKTELNEAQMTAELVVMQSQVEMAEAEVKVMQSEVDLRKVKSPLAGVVLLNKFVPGEVVEKKQILGEVFDDTEYIAKVKISERHVAKIHGPSGERLGEPVWVELAAYPSFHHGWLMGRVAYRPLVVTPQRTGDGVVLLYVHFDFYPDQGGDPSADQQDLLNTWAVGPDRRFIPGQTVNAEIMVGRTNLLYWLLGIETRAQR